MNIKENERNRIRNDKNIEKLANCNAITLISLVITIIILIILAGVGINLSIGENGIFNRAKQAKMQYEKSAAKEKLEIVLLEASIQKEENIEYNKEEFLNNMLEQNDIKVSGDLITVDNHIFLIDRDKLIIIEDLGQTDIKVKTEVKQYLGKNANNKYEVNLLLTIESNSDIQKIIIKNPDGTTYEMQTDNIKLGKDMTVELDEEYIAQITTKEGKNVTKKIVEKSEETIYTVEELVEFRNKVNTGLTYEGKKINLVSDLDLSNVCYKVDGTVENDVSWEPIGNHQTYGFKGSFNGNNHIIDNLYINTKYDNQGMFNKISISGTVENLILKGKITANSYIAAIAANNLGNIVNCINYCDIATKYGAGGITYNNSGMIKQCANKGNIIGNSTTNCEDIAGIAGINYGGTIQLCYNTGNITNNNTYAYDTGGIVGQNGNGAGNGTKASIIENCYNTGKITSSNQRVGGITGWNSKLATINNCYNIGVVSGNVQCGSIVGTNNSVFAGTITKSYFLSGTYSKGIGAGTGEVTSKTSEQLKALADTLGEFFTSDIRNDDGIWKYNNGYPILSWQILENR